jgi:hypothetical protein
MFKTKEMKATIRAYKEVFESQAGQLVLKDLMKSCHMMSSTFDKDPYETHFNEGARSVVVRILKTTNTSMDKVNEMIRKLEEEGQYE